MDSLYLITVKKITSIFQKTLTRSYDEKEKFGPRSKTKKNTLFNMQNKPLMFSD